MALKESPLATLTLPGYRALAVAGLLTLLFLLAPRLSLAPLFGEPAHYLPLHTAMEFFAIVVAMLVFAIGWTGRGHERPRSYIILACGFLAVGLLDFAHTLSYAGMPAFVSPSSPEKAINFWLAARYTAAFTLLAAALAPWRPFAQPRLLYLLLTLFLAIAATCYGVILLAPEMLPRTFIPGQGLTSFKVGAEYLLFAIHATTTVLLFRVWRRHPEPHLLWLVAGVWIMGLSELYFTLYMAVTDFYNLLGHAYKVAAYIMVYRAVFVTSVRDPYERLRESQEQLAITQYAVDHAGDLVFWFGSVRREISSPPMRRRPESWVTNLTHWSGSRPGMSIWSGPTPTGRTIGRN